MFNILISQLTNLYTEKSNNLNSKEKMRDINYFFINMVYTYL